MDALALKPTWSDQAQHCLDFALSLDPTDPLALRMMRVARRFRLLADAERERDPRRRVALIAQAHRLTEARAHRDHAGERRPAPRNPIAPLRTSAAGGRPFA